MSLSLPEYSDILSAAEQINGHAVRTPLVRSDVLDRQLGARVFIKAECLQRTGSFKFRGACNRISRLSEDEKIRGILAYSSGNHAQGVAAAAKIFGTDATILMPSDAPAAKVEGVKFWGGKVITYDRATQNREAIGQQIAQTEGRVLVPPYEDRFIMAGQGTTGLEICQQMTELGLEPDIIAAPAGGGGLIAGTGLAVLHNHPGAKIWSAEPEEFDDHKRSLFSGHIERNVRLNGSVCDAIITPEPGAMTWQLNHRQLAGGAAVSDAQALEAVAFAWRHLKLVIEPGGAVALASLLNGKIDVAGKVAVIVASGGNVDRAMFNRALAGS